MCQSELIRIGEGEMLGCLAPTAGGPVPQSHEVLCYPLHDPSGKTQQDLHGPQEGAGAGGVSDRPVRSCLAGDTLATESLKN